MTETSTSVILVLATAQLMPAFQRIRNSVECTTGPAFVAQILLRYYRLDIVEYVPKYRETTGAEQLLNHPLICNRFNWSANSALEKLVFVKQKPLSGNRREMLWKPKKFFVVVVFFFVLFCFFHFFNSDPTQKQNSCLTTTEELTNRNIRLRNSCILCEHKTKYCAPSNILNFDFFVCSFLDVFRAL